MPTGRHSKGRAAKDPGLSRRRFLRAAGVGTAGAMVAALLANEESEATVKHFSRRGGHVQLLPDNPAFDPIDGDQAQILGKVVAVLRRLR